MLDPGNKESLAVTMTRNELNREKEREGEKEKETETEIAEGERGIWKTRRKRVKGNRFVFADKRSPRTLIAFRVNARDREICHGCPDEAGQGVEEL